MPVLKDGRQELFAQGIISGKSQTQAYIDAGYSPKGAEVGASKLLRIANVADRVRELKEQAAKRAKLDRATVLDRLDEIAQLGMKSDSSGSLEYGPPGLAVARAALMDYSKLEGWVVDKNETALNAKVATTIRLVGVEPERGRHD